MLDALNEIKRRDPHTACDALAGFAAQCRAAMRLEPRPSLPRRRPSLIVVAGMGGSASAGDLLSAVAAQRADVPIVVHRGYGLPAMGNPNTLVIASSYSGDTAEVLSAVDIAIARKIPTVAITTGGRLGQLATEHGLPQVALPPGLQPRMAIGYLFFPALSLLQASGIEAASEAEIAEALEVMDGLAVELGAGRPTSMNEAKRLAVAIADRMPVIYGGPDTGPIAYRWKTDVEENAKTFALAGSLPEMNHNEIEAWRAPSATALHLVLLRDRGEPQEIARRFTVLRDLVGGAAGGVSEAWSRGQGRLARLLSLVYVGQWTSYYLALLRGVDPWSVPMLDEIKRRMRPFVP
jgi:glucose/mannose-6-phosphate isomerase